MFGTEKRRILVWSVIFSVIAGMLSSCTETSVSTEIQGETQGTTYAIIITDSDVVVTKSEIDSLFADFDASLSTYIEESVISKLNECSDSLIIEDPSNYFQQCYNRAQLVYTLTEGAFDPSVFPLVEGWGFMNNLETPLSQSKVDSILSFVSFEAGRYHTVDFEGTQIDYRKTHSGFKIDFNAIAQGFSVDVVRQFLEKRGAKNFYIEVGGEITVAGKNREGVNWKIGVDSPLENAATRELENIIHLSDASVATSGNYRKFYVKDGVKYAHTLNPATGFPVQHSLLSATVVSQSCADADAFATAFMVMGWEKSLEFLQAHPELNLAVYLLYNDEKGELQRAMSPGFEDYLSE